MWFEFFGLSANSASGIMSPEGQGANSSGSNKTGVRFWRCPWLTLQEMIALLSLGITESCLFVLTLHKSVSILFV